MSESPTIAEEKYVSFTTFKKDGTPVASPVWIAPLGDGTLGFTTEGDSWKAKRLANNADIVVQPCTMRGDVEDTAPAYKGTGRMVSGAEAAPVRSAIKAKYGWQVTMIEGFNKLKSLIGKGVTSPDAVIITLHDD